MDGRIGAQALPHAAPSAVVWTRCRYVTRAGTVDVMGARRSGSADLPLHGGRVPLWLAERMTRLGGVIAEAIVRHYGRRELLRRLAEPF